MELPIQSAAETPADQLELLTAIRDQLLLQNAQRRKQRWLLRICAAACAVLALTVLLLCAILLPQATQLLSEARTVLQALDTEQLANTMADLNATARYSVGIAQDAQKVLASFAEIDVDTLNGSLADLNGAIQKFSELDIDTLNRAIANLNNTVEPLARFFGLG